MMTLQDLYDNPRAYGWRRERLGPNLRPVVTNAPRGKTLCAGPDGCGQWIPTRQLTAYVCNPCKVRREQQRRAAPQGNV